MPVSTADAAFLSQEWRWIELSDASIKTRYSGAREADRGSPLLDSAAAAAVLTPLHNLLIADNRLIAVTVAGILQLSFKIRPPTVMLFHNRFDLSAGRKMICERADVLWARRQTVLYLYG